MLVEKWGELYAAWRYRNILYPVLGCDTSSKPLLAIAAKI